MADQPMTLGEFGEQQRGLGILERYEESRRAAAPQTPGAIDALKGAIAPETLRPAFKPAVDRILYGTESGPAPAGPMPDEQPSAAPVRGYGPMPSFDVPYYQGGADAEIARIKAKYDEGVARLEDEAAMRGRRGLASRADIFANLEMEKAELAKQRDQEIAKLALHKETPRGNVEQYRRQAHGLQMLPYEQAAEMQQLSSDTARDAATLMTAERREAQRADDEIQQQARDYHHGYEQAMLKYELAAQEVAKKKVDPRRWYRNQSTGEKVLAIIGGFIGGVSSALNKTPNVVLDQINREVDRDIDAQEKDLQNERMGLGAQLTVLGQMRQHFGDMRAAKLAAKAAINERTVSSLKTLMATTKSEAARKRVGHLLQAAEAQGALFEQGIKLDAMAQGEALKNAYMRARAQPQRQALEWKPISESDRARYVPGLGGYAADAQSAKKLREADAARRDVDEQLRILSGYFDDPKAAIRGTETYDRANGTALIVQNKMRKAFEMGALDAQSYELMKDMVPKPTIRSALGFGGAKKQVEDLRRMNNATFERKAETEGVMPATIERRYDDKGQLRLMTLQPPSSVQAGGGTPIQTAPVE